MLLNGLQYGKATLLYVFRRHIADPIVVHPLVMLIIINGEVSFACRRCKLLYFHPDNFVRWFIEDRQYSVLLPADL